VLYQSLQWYYPELEAWLFGYEDEEGVWQGYVDERATLAVGGRFLNQRTISCFFRKMANLLPRKRSVVFLSK
jgi:hypothetical protein